MDNKRQPTKGNPGEKSERGEGGRKIISVVFLVDIRKISVLLANLFYRLRFSATLEHKA